MLDLDLLKYAIQKDEHIDQDIRKTLTVTCVDQIKDKFQYVANDRVITHLDLQSFLEGIGEFLNINEVGHTSTPWGDNTIL